MSKNNLVSHIASWAHVLKATYSASAVDMDTVVCFLDNQLTGPPCIINMFPETDFLSLVSLAKSESEYPFKLSVDECLYKIP